MIIYHIVDHEGYGTMHKLIEKLETKFHNNKLIPLENISQIQANKNDKIIIHSTGRVSELIKNLSMLWKESKKYIFLHVSYDYLKFKNKHQFVDYLLSNQDLKKTIILTPSKEVTMQYMNTGLNAKTIQLGIPDIQNNKYYFSHDKNLEQFYNKIITTCSSEKPEYLHIKGIDSFYSIVDKLSLTKDSLIAGIDNQKSQITSKKFNENEFLNILAHSKAYVQCSRYESYNLTATQAKRFKKPVFVLNTEGVNSCMKDNVYQSIQQLTNSLVKYLKNPVNEYEEVNYIDSLNRESLESFNKSLELL